MNKKVAEFMEYVKARNPGEPEFHQAVFEVVNSIMPVVEKNRAYQEAKILERIVENRKDIVCDIIALQ